MLACFAADLGLVLHLEISRRAVEEAIEASHPFVFFHVGLAVTTMLLYFVQIGLGFAYYRGRNLRNTHRKMGYLFLFFRFLTLVTSFWVADLV